MATKFELLAALVDAEADRIGEKAGYHHTIVGVLRRLDEVEQGDLALDQLADSIYFDISGSLDINPFGRTPQSD